MIEMEPVGDDVRLLKQAFGCFPSGVAAICALVEGEPVGMVASSFTSVSIRPPLVSVCMQDTSATWPRLRGRARIGVSVLAEDHEETCLRLARKEGDRFGGVRWEAGREGEVFLPGASAWLDCSLYAEHPAGDHSIVLLEIHRLGSEPGTPPLVFHGSRFRRLMAV
ncbi:flavin reductase (DIM6/NTAB) family NADH-FMN oxidoreductase RutF [Thermocatellispora tengchongensis]|uniref:Flavin reductase (DIM6/NTAB) family NADH-FMN oxidoreductase RutF n=1 Tax=Thermocatellispora tengchongensis TaxID=1073253 RepID=A0A840PHW0_9ACTN|nr:flavin reductase family protein [Thermocatellispora tengchongensis]MBB5138416.1 flavin reductase (DIM6/NTAB) family NADH-FMN oxidoreductase RutF [Thermocatellispora tengchongensis]